MSVEGFPQPNNGNEAGKNTADAFAKERERILAEIESGPIKVEIDRKRGIMRHVWPAFTAISLLLTNVVRESVTTVHNKQSEGKTNIVGKDKECVQLEKKLTENVPSYVINALWDTYCFEMLKLKAATNGTEKLRLQMSGLEHINLGLSNAVNLVLSENNGFYPKGWLNGKIDFLSVSTNLPPTMSESYGTNFASSLEGGHFSRSDRLVALYTNSYTSDPIALSRVIAHESGHANDWFSNNSLSYKDRLNLFKSVIARLQSEDRFKSDYVEKIQNPNKKEEVNHKATEYWAEICEYYFNAPKDMKVKYPFDFRLVNEYVHRTDPNFNPQVSTDAMLAVLHITSDGSPEDEFSFMRSIHKPDGSVQLVDGKKYTRKEYIAKVASDLKDRHIFIDEYK